ncbi:endothelin-converting enzyme 2-like [Ornithodoros turicata]|uniref:endothelin-converting enzyme 2-like n=1 Tax=Ornithodoros turicata TaxID=34597 RepID=UPI003139AE67
MESRRSTLRDIWTDSLFERCGSVTSPESKPLPKRKRRQRLSTTALQEALSSYTPQPESERTIRQKWKWVIISGVAFITVSTILGSFIFLRARKSARKGEYSVCRTRPCRLYATLLGMSINTNRDPCENFYSYVCDGWDRKQKESVYWTHVMDYSGQLSDSLTDSTVPPFNQSAVEKAMKLYMSCRRASAGGPGERDEFRKLWSDCEIYWPRPTENANIFKTLILLYNTFQQENVLNFKIPRPEGSPYLYIFLGNQLSVLYNMSVRIKAAAGYQDYYESVQRMLKTGGTKETELLPYREFVKIESFIQNAMVVTLNKTTMRATPMNLSELAQLTPNISADRWLESLAFLDLPDSSPITIESEAYIRAFDRIFKEVGEKELHRYVGWVNIQQMAPFINRDLQLAAGEIVTRPSRVALASCMYRTEIFMGWAMYARVAADTFTSASKADLHSLVKNIADTTTEQVILPGFRIKKALLKSTLKTWRFDLMKYPDRFPTLKSLDIMFANMSDMGDSLMKNWVNAVASLARINHTTLALGAPHFVGQVINSEYFDFHNVEEGTYALPPTAVVMPLYEYGISEAVKYGGLGLLLAKSALAIVRYHVPTFANLSSDCFEESFEGTPFKDDSILETAISLSIAWIAFSRRSSTEVRLQFLRTVTDKQIFFIATCYLLCGQEERKLFVRMCNEPLKHNAEFSEAFACDHHSPMNKGRKCEFFAA